VKETFFLTVVTPSNVGQSGFAEIQTETVFSSAEFKSLLADFEIETVPEPQVFLDSIRVHQIQFVASETLNEQAFRLAVASIVAGDVFLARTQVEDNKKRLVIMDVDSTVIQNEVIELLAAKAGKEAEVKRITDAAMAGELDFAQSLRTRVQTLEGLSSDVLQQVYAEIEYTPGARELCSILARQGVDLALVSGGFTEIVQWIAKDLGITHYKANQLEIIDGALTGMVKGAIVDRATKAQTLDSLALELEISLADCVAIGDGANDLDMIALAGLGIAFNAKPIVQSSADVSINTPDLRAALFAMGFAVEVLEGN
jgi:phosphoserine phosphatase